MIDAYAALAHHLLQVAIANPVTAIPTHRPKDDLVFTMTSLELCHDQLRSRLTHLHAAIESLQQSHHVRLHCFFVIELKVGKFKPEYAGKLNFYLSAVDDTMRTERDEPTIGLFLCESHEGSVIEY
jgi:hypothetical protein